MVLFKGVESQRFAVRFELPLAPGALPLRPGDFELHEPRAGGPESQSGTGPEIRDEQSECIFNTHSYQIYIYIDI